MKEKILRSSVVEPFKSGRVINEYANSMFRYEYLHERWLTACVDYLRSLVGDSLKDKTAIDYAFGRGNWSVALARMSGAKVIAIDASADNVARFSRYCRKNKMDNIEVVHGNILEQSLDHRADFFWIYGILNNIQNQSLFLNKLVNMTRDENAQFFIYHYDARSLRQFIVESCRKIITYRNEDSFVKDSYLFAPAARIRARDDLTSPYVTFAEAQELDALLFSKGIAIRRSCDSFQKFQSGAPTPEFDPHHFFCDLYTKERNKVHNEPRAFLKDIGILQEMAESLQAMNISPNRHKKLTIGLYNTHFTSLYDLHDARPVIQNDFLFLFYAIIKNGLGFDSFSPITRRCLNAAVRSLKGKIVDTKMPESKTYMNESFLLDFLSHNNIRI